ncbi:MAG TPA: hypothetical protein VLV86_15895 [Vicinamibacterales bacterium]|nr:hypothetical protein [Vicinamibacterales bacterium]
MQRLFRAAALALVALAATVAAGCASGASLFQQFEYEEDIYLSLDGTATVYVNSSVPALNALRGTSLDTSPTARLDREAVRRFYTTPVTHVTQISQSRRGGRRFLHVRLDVDDVRRLGATAPFQWSRYEFRRQDDLYVYQQTIGSAANKHVGEVGWKGNEVVAFRLHLPSKITYHNAGVKNLRQGNILVWEQTLNDRLRGEPLVLDARMQTQSILYRTLLLFGATFVAVAAAFVIVIALVLRVGRKNVRTGTAGQAG